VADARIVTLLFTDLVGSTELLDRLGDLAAEHVRRTHFGLLRDAVAGTGGEEVKNLGDGLMVVFSSAADAVECAAEMQRAVDEHNRTAEDAGRFEVRVGLHVGEPIRDEGDYFGTPVVVAKRLCDRATGGQILASGLVHDLVASRGDHEFVSLGALELKGFAESVPAYEVRRIVGAAQARLELPATLVAGEVTGFVSRDVELGRLVEGWADARKGKGKLLVVSGEPGVGKTRLAAELARVAHVEGACVLHGRCYEEGVVPYQPFVEAVRPLVQAVSGDELRAAVPVGLPELGRLVPELGADFPVSDSLRPEPEAERYRLFEAFGALLDLAAGSAGTLVVLDDLHWADQPTLVLLAHLLRRPTAAIVQVLGTYRDTELAPTHPLAGMLGALRRDDGVSRVALHGLDADGVAALLRAWAGHDVQPDFVTAVFAETEGNPFFVNEVVRHLAESGAIYQRAGEWVSDLSVDQLGIPEGVREVVGRRLAHVGESAIALLTTAAIAGREFDAALVAEASSVDEGTALDALDDAVRGGLVQEVTSAVGRFTFSHALVQETLRHQIGTAKRAFLHRRVGEAIERRYPEHLDAHLSELAFHFGEAAAAANADKAVDYAARAGARALAQFAYEDAVAMFERALQALDIGGDADPTRRVDLLTQFGAALGWAGRWERAWALLDEAMESARQARDPERFALAVVEYARIFDNEVEHGEGTRRRIAEALALLPEGDSALRATLLVSAGGWLTLQTGEAERREQVIFEGLAMARRVGDLRAQASAIGLLNLGEWDPTRFSEALDLQREAIELANKAVDPEYEIVARCARAEMLVSAGRVAEAREEVARAGAVDNAIAGRTLGSLTILSRRIMFELLAGRFDSADQLAEELRATGGGLENLLTAQWYAISTSRVRSEQGRLAELEPLVRELVDATEASGWRARLAAMYVELERLDDAREQLELLGRLDLEAEARAPVWLVTAAYLAETARACTAVELARSLYPLVSPWTGRAVTVIGIACNGSIDRHLGLLAATLGRTDVAAAHFESALSMNRDLLESPPLTARIKVDYAAFLLERDETGDRERAQTELTDALATARELGMLRVAARAGSLLRTS
jgi:class 3 adenylate cyclase/tetratricopeptide (TPR) repeat protein